MSHDYGQTVNLPRTEFPMRAGLPQKEPEIQRRWQEIDLYGQIRRARAGRPKFILHDGPPYTSGEAHMGTALNKVLKDMVIKHATLLNYDAPYVPGWDTHGLPIERRALKELGVERDRVGVAELRDLCRDYALRFMRIMTGQFQRLGVLGNWDDPYITLDPGYESRQIRVFGEMAKRGYIYKGLKSVYWCPSCETALAEAEIEYQEVTSPSITVAFPVVDGRAQLPEGARVVVWTTTPWTMPANLAVALNPDAEYVLVRTEAGLLLLAAALQDQVLAGLGLTAQERIGRWPGRALEGVTYRHPLYDRISPLVLGEHVTTEDGTGLVHTAPGHGQEDFEVGRRYGLDVLVPIDDRGYLTEEAGRFAGLYYKDANASIITALRDAGALLAVADVRHQYAHCWRCHNAVIWRATEQWFASVSGFRQQALEAIQEVRWIPAWGRLRIESMVTDRGDWCISRQRAWGVPIPAFYCESCGEVQLNDVTIERVAALFAREGSNAWFIRSAKEILGDYACARCGGRQFRKETDTMDVWFDSGSSHEAVLAARPELAWPADMYLEGPDQYRGWYQSSLLTATVTRGHAPYRTVLTNGWVLDGEGREMHKSLGNAVDPAEVTEKYGADVLRLWVSTVDYQNDVRISEEILAQVADSYRKIRNTLRFVLGNLADYDPTRDHVPEEDWPELERYLIRRFVQVLERTRQAYAEYSFHNVFQAIYHFCAVEFSAFYFEVRKDLLYCAAPSDPARRAAQTMIYQVGRALLAILSPILVHTTEEAWQHLQKQPGDPESVHLLLWPTLSVTEDPALMTRWEAVLRVRGAVLRALEAAKAAKVVKEPTQAAVTLHLRGELAEVTRVEAERLAEWLGVAAVQWADAPAGPADADEPGATMAVSVAAGERCPRCRRLQTTVGQDPAYPELCSRCAAVVAGMATA